MTKGAGKDERLLGHGHDGPGGRLEVDFTWAEYKDSVFERRPDTSLKVHNPTTGKTTTSKVFYELSGKMADDDSEEVMDLGDVPVD